MPMNPMSGQQLSDTPVELMIEQYGGEVESQFAKASIMRQFVNVRTVRGTDTITNNRVGRTQLQKLVPGVAPEASGTPFGRVQLVVDTVILARDTRSMLNEFQTHFDARMELGRDHGKEIGKFYDEAHLIIAIKGAGASAPANLNGAIGAGKSVTLQTLGDELDPDKLYAAITKIITDMEDEDIDTDDLVLFVRPSTYKILLDHDKLMSREFSRDNGDFSKGNIYELDGVRIVKTARIPTAPITGHKLSNAANGNAYDVTSEEARTVAVIMHPKSLLSGETIPMTSDVFFNKDDKTWYIDTFISFGVAVNRPDVCGRVLKAAS